jgi:hypothetical protein
VVQRIAHEPRADSFKRWLGGNSSRLGVAKVEIQIRIAICIVTFDGGVFAAVRVMLAVAQQIVVLVVVPTGLRPIRESLDPAPRGLKLWSQKTPRLRSMRASEVQVLKQRDVERILEVGGSHGKQARDKPYGALVGLPITGILGTLGESCEGGHEQVREVAVILEHVPEPGKVIQDRKTEIG